MIASGTLVCVFGIVVIIKKYSFMSNDKVELSELKLTKTEEIRLIVTNQMEKGSFDSDPTDPSACFISRCS